MKAKPKTEEKQSDVKKQRKCHISFQSYSPIHLAVIDFLA